MENPKVYKHSIVKIGDLEEGQILQTQKAVEWGCNEYLCVMKKIPGMNRSSVTIQAVVPGTDMWDYFYLKTDSSVQVLTGNKGRELAKLHSSRPKPKFPKYVSEKPYMGSDPEIFVENEHKEIIPAWLFLGSKQKPTIGHQQTSGTHPDKRNNIYWDGFQAEFDTMQAQCIAWQMDSIRMGLKALLEAARKLDPKAKLSNATVIPMSAQILRESAEEHVQFGCMPSKNIYGLRGNKEDGRSTPYRFSGGHIHIGSDRINDKNEEKLVKVLDSILGVTCVSLFAEYDSPVRRAYYGLAGEYRRPAHGLEYRTLSNAWLMHPLLANMVMDLARASYYYAMEDCDGWEAKEDDVVKAIQECDVDLARSILKQNEGAFEKLLPSYRLKPVVRKIFQSGAETFIKNPEDIEGNWMLNGQWIFHCDGVGRNWYSSAATIEIGGKV